MTCLQSADELLSQWQQVRRGQQSTLNTRQDSRCQRWRKPQVGWLKCNIDAALFKQQERIGFGCVVRD